MDTKVLTCGIRWRHIKRLADDLLPKLSRREVKSLLGKTGYYDQPVRFELPDSMCYGEDRTRRPVILFRGTINEQPVMLTFFQRYDNDETQVTTGIIEGLWPQPRYLGPQELQFLRGLVERGVGILIAEQPMTVVAG